jgi:hypothetical protein
MQGYQLKRYNITADVVFLHAESCQNYCDSNKDVRSVHNRFCACATNSGIWSGARFNQQRISRSVTAKEVSILLDQIADVQAHIAYNVIISINT